MDRTALDWLFSTAPQALAALVGLTFAGMTFINGTIDKEIAQDESREEICEAMKEEIHSFMKRMFWFAGLSISIDLLILMINPLERDCLFSFSENFNPYILIVGLIFIFNIFTLCFSLWFIIRVASPQYFEKTVKKLSKESKDGDVDAKDFLMEFIKLEKVLRELPLDIDNSGKQHSVSDILRILRFRKILNGQDVSRLFEINKLRNLIVHGAEINHVSHEIFDYLKNSITNLSKIKEQLKNESPSFY